MPKSVTDQVGNCLSNILILLVSESVKINTAELLSGDFPKGKVDRVICSFYSACSNLIAASKPNAYVFYDNHTYIPYSYRGNLVHS